MTLISLRFLVGSAVLAVASLSASAQASFTASRTLGISVFAGGMHLNTDYGDTNYGVVFGADLTRRFRLFNAGLEARATISSQGDAVKETTFGGGLRLGKDFRRFHPYADVLVGEGTITFTHPVVYPTGPYASDNSAIFSFGGGLDYDLTHSFALKADYNSQSWHLGEEQNRLTPAAFTVGIVYQIPFGSRFRR